MLPSGLLEHVADEEKLSRFLTQRRQFNSIMAKPAAFLPNPKDGETSVSRHGGEPLKEFKQMGLIAAGERNLYGAAIFKAEDVRKTSLKVEADEPPLRHAAIRNWPWIEDDPELQKAKQKELALQLASAAGKPFLL